MLPGGGTVLQSNDTLLVLCDEKSFDEDLVNFNCDSGRAADAHA